MGLDQYMYKVKKELEEDYYEHLGEKVKDEFGYEYYDIEPVLDEIAYFRKSNWLHGYMNRLCQSKMGHDIEDCEYLILSQKDLIDFLNVCREVVECDSVAIAEELLPPQSGFFFGSTAIDDYYFEDVQDAIDALSPFEDGDNRYAYYAWW